MIVAVAKETFAGEQRVALVPASISLLKKAGLDVYVESGAGVAAGFPDQQYKDSGAEIVDSRSGIFKADIVLQVRSLGANQQAGRDDLQYMRSGQVIIGHADPLGAAESAKELAEKGVSLVALEMVPRITRAQSMDVLSSMATIAGYRAVLHSAMTLPKIFPMLMTAAGTLKAAKVLVIGAGVAGLQAIATARRLGAVVSGYDVRDAAKEQVQSLGAKFVELDLSTGDAEGKGGYAKAMDEAFYQKQRELLGEVVSESDVVISTAAIPGRKSPLLITQVAVEKMAPGSVIVDLAAERGGNCEVTVADQVTNHQGVTILGPTNLPSEIPQHASQMYAKNLTNLLDLIIKEGNLNLDLSDEIVSDTLVAHDGEVRSNRLREILGMEPIKSAEAVEEQK